MRIYFETEKVAEREYRVAAWVCGIVGGGLILAILMVGGMGI